MDGMDMGTGLSVDYVRQHANLDDVFHNFGCRGDECDEVFEKFTDHPVWFCSGEPHMTPGGNWKGHFLPGCLFILWASLWLLGTLRVYFDSKRHGEAYTSRAFHSFYCLPRGVEPWVKVVMPQFAMLMELYLAHENGFRTLVCPSGTPRAGHFVGNHINNWQHSYMYPAFVISGIVDLISFKVDLPQGTNQVFLALGFLIESMLMGLHKKHDPMDVLVHELLFYAMLASAVFAFAEAARPHVFMFSLGRVGATLLQGAWLMVAARVLYGGRTAWSTADGDMAPVSYLSIFFLMVCMAIVCGMLVVWLAMHLAYSKLGLLQGYTCAHGTDDSSCGVPSSKGTSESGDCDRDAEDHHHHHDHHDYEQGLGMWMERGVGVSVGAGKAPVLPTSVIAHLK